MKKIIIPILVLLIAVSCNDFLDVDNLKKPDTSNYPATIKDASYVLTSVYRATRDMEIDSLGSCGFIISEILSDDRFAGGGADDRDFRNLEKLEMPQPNMFSSTWMFAYQSIYRANTFFETIDNVTWQEKDQALKNNMLGQAHFLRAYSYFYLAKLFGSAPLVLSTKPVNLPRAEAPEMYGQIASDLTKAIELMPQTSRVSERGRTSRWAAEALLARVYLFYTGYYNQSSLPLAGGGEITKKQVIDYLDDCITNSGYKLVSDFRNIWPYSNEFTKTDGYKFSVVNDLKWIKEDNVNDEILFAWQSSGRAAWGNLRQANRINLYFSIREQDEAGIFPFGRGWGFGTVNPTLWDTWPNTDRRKKGSIIDVADAVNEMPSYQWGADRQMDETGYWQKKYIAVNVKTSDGKYVNYSIKTVGESVNTDYQLNNTQDLNVIRFADVLLMAAELKEDAGLLNQVRKRAGLDDVAYSLENLRNERRWEFAFEGLRYYDLLRYGLDYAGAALDKKNGVSIKNANEDGHKDVGSNIASRVKATGGFMPIPQEEISLSNGVLKQTQGW